MQYSSSSSSIGAMRIFSMKPSVLDEAYFDSNILSLDVLRAKDDKIVFSRPLFFLLEHDGNGFYAKNNDLNVCAYGATRLALYDDIHDEILAQWELYANEADDNMTPDAQRLKSNLRELVVLKESVIHYA